MSDARPFDSHHYSDTGQAVGSRSSADVILPLAFSHLGTPGSVLDVGCGAGTWLAACQSLGVPEIVGVEGGHPSDDDLQVPRESLHALDLTQPVDLGRRFDLVISMEVAEHIPADRADVYVSTLARHGDALIFSAAIPDQGGTFHVNERWPSYWYPLLTSHGFECFDVVRPAVWDDAQVEFWYRQNTLIYARGDVAENLRRAGLHAGPPLALVHPLLYTRKVDEARHPHELGQLRRELPAAVRRRLSR